MMVKMTVVMQVMNQNFVDYKVAMTMSLLAAME